MSYPIDIIANELSFDKLLVQKLQCNKSIPINERVFAQGQVGLDQNSIFVRILAFDDSASEDSKVIFTLKNGDIILTASTTQKGDYMLTCGDAVLSDKMTSYIVTGEDLQGEYWSGVFIIPISILFDFLKIPSLSKGDVLSGNLVYQSFYASVAFADWGEFIIS